MTGPKEQAGNGMHPRLGSEYVFNSDSLYTQLTGASATQFHVVGRLCSVGGSERSRMGEVASVPRDQGFPGDRERIGSIPWSRTTCLQGNLISSAEL